MADSKQSLMMSEFIFQMDAACQQSNIAMIHRLISEAALRSDDDPSTFIILSQPIHLDRVRTQAAYLHNPKSFEESLFSNPLKRIKEWKTVFHINSDVIDIETSKGKCRIFNLDDKD